MIVRRAHPFTADAAGSIDLDASDARGRLAGWYAPPRRDWIRLNLVASVNGSAAGADGTSDGLSNPADRAILGVIRDLSDVVLVGAHSVRAEGYVMPRRADLAIVTSSGDFGTRGIPERSGSGELLVFCPASAAERVRASGIGSRAQLVLLDAEPDGRIAPAMIVSALRERGHASIVCEGGPSLAGQLIEDGLVDEFALTTSPRISPVALPLLGNGALPAIPLTLEQLLIDDADTVYARWLVAR